MNAQRRWKLAYIRWCTADSAETRSHAAHAMSRFNREAALERKLEAANRRIEEQARFIAGLEDQLKFMESIQHDQKTVTR